MNEFMTPEMLGTFTGLATAVALIVQFTKGFFKNGLNDYVVRIYAFIVALVLTFIFTPAGYDISGISLTVINAILVTLTAIGGYEVVADPYAEKKKNN